MFEPNWKLSEVCPAGECPPGIIWLKGLVLEVCPETLPNWNSFRFWGSSCWKLHNLEVRPVGNVRCSSGWKCQVLRFVRWELSGVEVRPVGNVRFWGSSGWKCQVLKFVRLEMSGFEVRPVGNVRFWGSSGWKCQVLRFGRLEKKQLTFQLQQATTSSAQTRMDKVFSLLQLSSTKF